MNSHTEEIWKPIVGWEGRYEISSTGRIGYFRGGKRQIKKSFPHTKNGHLLVNLGVNDKHVTKAVRQLVADHFLPSRPPGHQIIFRDDNKTNCAAGNLFFLSQSEAARLRIAAGAQKPMRGGYRKPLTPEQRAEVLRLAGEGLTQGEIGRRLGIGNTGVSRLLKRLKEANTNGETDATTAAATTDGTRPTGSTGEVPPLEPATSPLAE